MGKDGMVTCSCMWGWDEPAQAELHCESKDLLDTSLFIWKCGCVCGGYTSSQAREDICKPTAFPKVAQQVGPCLGSERQTRL